MKGQSSSVAYPGHSASLCEEHTVPLEENTAMAEKWQNLTWAACISGGHLALKKPWV